MKKNIKGFTLIEVLLYLAMLSVFIVVIASFWQGLMDVTQKGKAMNTVNTEGQFMMTKILQKIRESESITSPLAGNSASSLNLANQNLVLNPTIMEFNNGSIRISEGVTPFASLNSGEVVVSNVSFTNNTATNSKGLIRVQFTVNYKNPDGRSNLNYSQTFYGAASLR